jgi:hypothetical protein
MATRPRPSFDDEGNSGKRARARLSADNFDKEASRFSRMLGLAADDDDDGDNATVTGLADDDDDDTVKAEGVQYAEEKEEDRVVSEITCDSDVDAAAAEDREADATKEEDLEADADKEEEGVDDGENDDELGYVSEVTCDSDVDAAAAEAAAPVPSSARSMPSQAPSDYTDEEELAWYRRGASVAACDRREAVGYPAARSGCGSQTLVHAAANRRYS